MRKDGSEVARNQAKRSDSRREQGSVCGWPLLGAKIAVATAGGGQREGSWSVVQKGGPVQCLLQIANRYFIEL